LTIEEIARVTDVGVETAKSRLRYAVSKLKKSLLPAAIPDARPVRTLNAST
jgi:DNA-directed RNA polymerase specialized sigma24 family protein